MHIICSAIALILINGCYLVTSFNMESIVAQSGDEETSEIVLTSDPSRDIELADLLDLDIFDFDIDELADSNEERDRRSIDSRRADDLAIRSNK